MSIGDTISSATGLDAADLPRASRIATLLGRCGLAGRSARRFEVIEALEPRVMLADDHPNFGQVFPTPIAPVVNINLDPGGQGSANGVIDYIQDNDMFRFTAPSTDFVTVWADTINEPTGVSVLNSMIQIYTRNPNGTAKLITSGKDSDLLTSGLNNDGWVGFLAQAGVEYFIRVLADSPPVPTLPTGVGAYVVRVDAKTDTITVQNLSGEPTAPITGTLTLAGSDRVYKFTAPTSGNFDSLFTFGDQSLPADLDGRLDIYDSNGVRVAFDSESGRLNNAFTTVRGAPGAVFYVRFRSDSFSVTDPTSTGGYQFTIDASATTIPLDPVQRFGSWFDSAGGNTHKLMGFVSLGTGRTIITVYGAGLPPLVDPAVRLYNDAGQQIAFNDDFVGLNAQIEIDLVGDQQYFVVVEGFDVANAGGFVIAIESNHTFTGPPTTTFPWDDHEDLPAYDPQQMPPFGSAAYNDIRRAFERATPLVWTDPRFYLDPAGQPLPDRGMVTDAFGQGRIYGTADSDLFQFTVPTDMLFNHAGNNDDAGTAVYIGGAFTTAGNLTTTIRGTANHIAAWDANDYFPALRGLNGTVYSMVSFDLDGDQLEELYVGGQFTTAGNTANPAEDLVVNNIARWAWNPLTSQFEWSTMGNGLATGPVYALTIYDAEAPTGGGPDPGPVLVAGGGFTAPGKVAVWNALFETWGALPGLGAVTGTVYALTSWQPVDPDQGGPYPDLPNQLVVGGDFSAILGGPNDTARNVFNFDPEFGLGPFGNFGAQNGTDGPVRALAVYDPPDPDGAGPAPNPEPYLVVAGQFTGVDDHLGALAVNNIARWDIVPPTGGTNATLAWRTLGSGVTGGTTPAVYAMTVWDATTIGGENPPPMLVIGGSFTNPGANITMWDGTAYNPLERGLNGTVRALTTAIDVAPDVNYNGPVLFAGGDFTTFNYDGPGGAVLTGPATRVAEFDWNIDDQVFQWGGGRTNLQGQRTGGMETGLDATVYALDDFDDGNPTQWDRHERPAARLQVIVDATLPYINTFMQVYDSNFNLIYENERINPLFPDPSGMLDPSMGSPDGVSAPGIPVWGGEVYYISVTTVGSTGRYQLQVTADALVEDNTNSTMHEETDAGDWNNARELTLALASGDVRNSGVPGTVPAGAPLPPLSPSPNFRMYQYTQHVIPIAGVSELGNIHDIDDTDLFFFRAPSNGTAEIRLDTTFLYDQFQEFVNGVAQQVQRRAPNGQGTGLALNSHFDAVIRIFNNDFEQIAYCDNFAGVDGEYTFQSVGTFGDPTNPPTPTDPARVFMRRDPAVYFQVAEGQRYFVQIESAALADYLAFNYGEIDWRAVMGGYELLINTMPNLNFVDDHANALTNLVNVATMVGINQVLGDPNNGQGQVVGEVDSNISNPEDSDLFSFIATHSGIATLRVTPTSATLRPFVAVNDDNLILISTATAPSAGQPVEIQLSVQQGERYYVSVAGRDPNFPASPLTEGSYVVSLSGMTYSDDHGSPHLWSSATEIAQPLYDYDGFEQLAGSIEYAGDVDIFKFTTLATDTVTITIDGLGQFDPFVRVYEVSDDPIGNAVFLQIAYNDDITPGTNRDSRVTFPTTAPDRVSSLSGLTLNHYYIVVSGFDPETVRGDYTLTLETDATDDHPDQGQWPFATDVPINGPTGQGSGEGAIERIGDSDLVSFVAAASGMGFVSVTSPITSQLRHSVRVFDENFNPVVDLVSGLVEQLGPDTPASTVTFQFEVARDKVYYVLIKSGPFEPLFTHKVSQVGAYTIGVTTPTADDHANENEWDLATTVPLSIVTGDGSATGIIGITTDTDLFQVIAIADGDLRISIDTPGSGIRPVLRLFRADFSEIGSPVVDGGPGDEDGLLNGSVTRTIQDAVIDDVHYFLVNSDPSAAFTTGGYNVTIRGNDPPHFPPDDHADETEFEDATVLSLEPLNGDATETGGIQFDGDTDLFTFLTHGKGRNFVQIVTPSGQSLDLAVRVFNELQEEIAFDLNGLPGANANVSFDATGANQRFYILVTTVGAPGTGEYTVRLDSAPEVYRLFYPEGFASPAIREFIALANPNTTSVTYTVRLRYEDPALPEVVVALNQVLGPGQRGGLTISDGTPNPLHGLLFGRPYAIVIESDAPMGASLSHYDFGNTIGESFTDRISTFWSFPRGERFPGAVNDFLVFYNPNATRAVVVLTAYRPDGTTVSFTQTVEGHQRSGWAFNQLTTLPPGAFAFTVSSAPETPSDPHLGIVAALSHYDTTNSAGDASLGDPDGGATRSVIPGITYGPNNAAQVTVFNSGDTAAQVIMRVEYIGSVLSGFTRTINLAPRSATTIEGAALGLAANQTAGITFNSDQKVSVFARERQFGDGNATMAYTEAGTRWFFGDAFINVARAGVQYFENLYFYNPDNAGVTADVRILFVDGTVSTTSIFVGPQGFSRLRLHQLPEILNRGGLQFFAIDVSALRPISVTMDHYDLFLQGGWGSKGAALGLTTPISSIII